jgi:hypothetical protein
MCEGYMCTVVFQNIGNSSSDGRVVECTSVCVLRATTKTRTIRISTVSVKHDRVSKLCVFAGYTLCMPHTVRYVNPARVCAYVRHDATTIGSNH